MNKSYGVQEAFGQCTQTEFEFLRSCVEPGVELDNPGRIFVTQDIL